MRPATYMSVVPYEHSSMRVFARALCLLALLLAGLAIHADVAVPPLAARVTDLTGTLQPSQRETLERELEALEQRKGSQLAVLILATTRPETVEQYALRVAEAWKLGRKGIDDGLLLLFAKDDRELRIEVGYGLEGVVPDAVAKRVISEIITPKFRQNDFYGGLHAGVSRLILIIDGEPLPPPSASTRAVSEFGDYLPMIFFAVLVAAKLLSMLFGRLTGAAISGGIGGVLVWLALGSLLMALGAGVFVILFALTDGGGRGGYGGGSIGGSGGGGFGGGGGGFGGGGASGKW